MSRFMLDGEENPEFYDYQLLTVHFVMRLCKDKKDAMEKLEKILPQHPDENHTYCESWVIEGSEYDC